MSKRTIPPHKLRAHSCNTEAVRPPMKDEKILCRTNYWMLNIMWTDNHRYINVGIEISDQKFSEGTELIILLLDTTVYLMSISYVTLC